MAAVALLVGGAAACEPVPPDTTPPSWRIVDRAHATALGPHVELFWDAAQGAPSRYRIDVNGVTVPMVDPTATRCVVVGLAGGGAYTFRITAYDAAGNWSDSLPIDGQHDPGYRPASRTTPPSPHGGPTLRCVPATDTDGDRLPDALETNTGTYANTAATGTSPTVVDTDADGLTDGDEVLGTPGGLDLYGMGTRPMRPDLLLEVDWFSGLDPQQCAGNLTPQTSWWPGVVAGFASVRPPTPGGAGGINLIVDHGQGGRFTGGTGVPDSVGAGVAGDSGDGDIGDQPEEGETYRSLETISNDGFASNRIGYFHHALVVGRLWIAGEGFGTRSLAEFKGDKIWLALGCGAIDPWWVASQTMHELGHNLALNHGGLETTNHKPSYSSVMNYRYTTGLDGDCDGWSDEWADRRLGFSDGSRPPIDENHIVEAQGICGSPPVDLDGDGSIDAQPYARDLTYDGQRTVLHDHDDRAGLDLRLFALPANRMRQGTVVE